MGLVVGAKKMANFVQHAIKWCVSVVPPLYGGCKLMLQRSAVHFWSTDTAKRLLDDICKSERLDFWEVAVAIAAAHAPAVSIHLEWLDRN